MEGAYLLHYLPIIDDILHTGCVDDNSLSTQHYAVLIHHVVGDQHTRCDS